MQGSGIYVYVEVETEVGGTKVRREIWREKGVLEDVPFMRVILKGKHVTLLVQVAIDKTTIAGQESEAKGVSDERSPSVSRKSRLHRRYSPRIRYQRLHLQQKCR